MAVLYVKESGSATHESIPTVLNLRQHGRLACGIRRRVFYDINQVNDDFCDCMEDGLDEPRTSACSHVVPTLQFACRTPTPVQLVPVTTVRDGSVPTKRANTVLVQVDATTLLCLGGKERIKRREPGPRYGNVHTPGVYSVTDEATLPRPPVTPVGLFKRKRSATDSPEAPQKPLKRLDVTTRPRGGGVATADGDMKSQ
ncbi:hypothetical protein H257_12182 [Aphanomyces astaci]|uniref:Glucosidase II beta subunit N-terminal domain-containing protein n=1 Tax=Aphanomyces astaci TaxID=112090 RepID=W4FZC0_APHAT|nr:hypothetical protein H257_12182 [Aphanomyces astaci]ETV72825.1 hypothetical protein H257_12182 [Aphanomyces astaci]|eukprot:XP_009837611.1 hypothetical protein H257_12182 [Aphanomyces astaci]